MGGKSRPRQGKRRSRSNQQKEVSQSPVILSDERDSVERISESSLGVTETPKQQTPSVVSLAPQQIVTELEGKQAVEATLRHGVPSGQIQKPQGDKNDIRTVTPWPPASVTAVSDGLNPTAHPDQMDNIDATGSSKSVENPKLAQGPHPLETPWTCYYTDPDMPKQLWKQAVKDIHSFSSVEEFWSVYNHLVPPTKLKMRSDLSWFRGEGATKIKPEWENAQNKHGGCWKVVFLHKSRDMNFDFAYKEVLMLMIGEQFGEFNDIVNGMVAQTRGVEDVRLQVWTTTTNEASNRFIARKIIQALQAAQVHARMEFHDFSKAQKHLFSEG